MIDNMSWWEWCIKHCSVSYDNNNKEQIMNNDKEEEDNVLELCFIFRIILII